MASNLERFVGPLITVDATLNLDIECRIKNNLGNTILLTGSLLTLVAGVYTPTGLVEECGDQIKIWFLARLAAGAGMASVTDADIFLEWKPQNGVNLTLARLEVGSLYGATLLGSPASIDYVMVKMSSEVWAHLGLLEGGATANRTVNSVLTGGVWIATMDGLWQPKGAFCFLRAETGELGDTPLFHDVFTQELRDGGVSQSVFGAPSFQRDYTLLDQRSTICGPLYRVAEFESIDVLRKIVNCRLRKTTASRMQDSGYRAGYLIPGRYYMMGHADLFLFRLKSFAIAGGFVQLTMYEKIPAGVAVPPGQSSIYGVPEALALLILTLEGGGMSIYEGDTATGKAGFTGGIYSLRASGDLSGAPQRRDRAHPLYSMKFELVGHGAPSTVKP